MHPENTKARKVFGASHGFKVCTSIRYLGGYIGDDESKREWLKYWMENRERNIYAVTKMAEKYHRESYATVVRAIQSEWKILQLVTKDMEHEFSGVEKVLQETFLPRLFLGKSKNLPPFVGTISTPKVNKSGLGLYNPVAQAEEKYTGLLCESYDLIGSVTGERELSNADHLWVVKEERRDGKKYWYDGNDAKLRVTVNDQVDFEKRIFLQAKHTGSWLSVRGTTVTGTVLADTEFRDFYVHIITLNQLNFKENETVTCSVIRPIY